MPLTILPKGISDTASYLDRTASEAKRQHFESSAAFSRQSVYSELIKIWRECYVPNWDGEGAYPVEEVTLNNACDLIAVLPLGCPLPSAGVEPDGHLTLEWYRHPRWLLSVSISPERILYYAALFGSNEIKGAERFWSEVPQIIQDLIKRVQMA